MDTPGYMALVLSWVLGARILATLFSEFALFTDATAVTFSDNNREFTCFVNNLTHFKIILHTS